MACTWLGEIASWSCLTALPGPALVLLSKIYKPFPGSLHNVTREIWKKKKIMQHCSVCFTDFHADLSITQEGRQAVESGSARVSRAE